MNHGNAHRPRWSAATGVLALLLLVGVAAQLRLSIGRGVTGLCAAPGVDADAQRASIAEVNRLNGMLSADRLDPEIQTRIAQYELAFRMQTSVPELVDLTKERKETLDLYGPEVSKPGSYAHSALMARRLVERGVRVVQILHRG